MKTNSILKSGFTLSELLVVIAIIGILASILLPVISRVKQKANQVNCLSNMKQIGVAYASYAHDHGKVLPFTRAGSNNGWVDAVRSYEITDDILNCPSCNRQNKNAYGDFRTAWRTGGGAAANADTFIADNSKSLDKELANWARLPDYYKFVAGENGRHKTADFTLAKKACFEMYIGESCPVAIQMGKKGGSAVLLLMCENLAPSSFSLKITETGSGRALGELDGVFIGNKIPCKKGSPVAHQAPPQYDGKWELFNWSGPLAQELGGNGSMLTEQNPIHKTPYGFNEARFLAKKSLTSGTTFPNPPSGGGAVNYLFMRTVITATENLKLNLTLSGDDAYSAFVLKGGCCSGGPGSPCDPGKPASSTYSINAWAQSEHSLGQTESGKFMEILERGRSDVPAFTEGIWTDIMPRSSDVVPPNLRGNNGGLARAVMKRHGYQVNTAFMDGSARAVALDELWKQPWHLEWKAPTTQCKLPNR